LLLLLGLLSFSLNNAQVIEDILCEGRVFSPRCTAGTIRIVAASFGVTDGHFCGGTDHTQWTVNCAVDVAENLRNLCGGRQTCSVPVEGRNACAGGSKFLQIVWGCDIGVPQNRVNNHGANIVASSSPIRTAPAPLHAQTVRGPLYVFMQPTDNIVEVRWFIDQTDLVVSTVSTAPYDLYPGRAWDTTTVTDGTHRLMALVAFSDGTTGTIDATLLVRNGATVAAANTRASESFVDSATIAENKPVVPSAVPWTLFAIAILIAVVLLVVVLFQVRSARN